MAILFKCKMCGGNLEVEQESRVGTCVYCGSAQTLPKLDDERRVGLFNRGTHARRNGDYDKAAGIFEIILNEDPADAEAYWSLVLCRYGIVYVEDSATGSQVPTINRLQAVPILADSDYQQALAHVQGGARSLYEQEAEAIGRIQRDALAIVDSGEAYDVFICYKETDASGQRSRDSLLAQELYQELSRQGVKAFYARVSLAEKAGTEYESYIFAALHSARAMVVVGTSKDNLEAVWVRNEWSRYLALMKDDPQKVLFPVYRDMDPYDLPLEFSSLQALDASRMGFMLDLVNVLGKAVRVGVSVTAAGAGAAGGVPAAHSVTASPAASLVKRARLCCEDGDFAKAKDLIEQALNLDPENGETYFVAL
ncbi:MAG: toll/interleukin-1 receptor domain-containing protein, partial [Coriobacteriales bacterium]|nr:toll/interleukin-1 receptor domain-containing protein [Coriobacteriales bacterium]